MNLQHATDCTARPAAADRFSVEGAASYVGLSVSFLNRARLVGDGPVFIKLGRRVVYDRDDLNTWLESRKRRSTSEAA